jgi:hypothetical protein
MAKCRISRLSDFKDLQQVMRNQNATFAKKTLRLAPNAKRNASPRNRGTELSFSLRDAFGSVVPLNGLP